MLEQRNSNKPLERAQIHEVLSNDRRWRTLELLEESDPRNLRSLADDIAAAESGESPAPRDLRQSVYVTLHQNHLPKLDSLNIVQYDDTSKTVALGKRADDIDIYLEVVERGHLSYSEYYLGVVVLGLLTTVASSIGTPILVLFDPAVYASMALVTLLLSIAHQMHKQGSPWLDRLTGA